MTYWVLATVCRRKKLKIEDDQWKYIQKDKDNALFFPTINIRLAYDNENPLCLLPCREKQKNMVILFSEKKSMVWGIVHKVRHTGQDFSVCQPLGLVCRLWWFFPKIKTDETHFPVVWWWWEPAFSVRSKITRFWIHVTYFMDEPWMDGESRREEWSYFTVRNIL